jgi:hypothetical protein
MLDHEVQGEGPVGEKAVKEKAVKEKLWRAKEACTFGGKFVKQGETVFAEKMDNPHFEPVA